MRIPFTKMHGCGNDYIYVNAIAHKVKDPQAAAEAWSDRHKGIGSDGLVLIDKPTCSGADFSMRIFNADGSEAMMCGNASRCIGKYLYERGLTNRTAIRLQTLSGIKTLHLTLSYPFIVNGRLTRDVESVTVDMGQPILEDRRQYDPSQAHAAASALPRMDEGMFVSMGNPHFVIFTEDVDQVETIGKVLEHHRAFPQRCNIELAHLQNDGTLRTRVWERGSGITMACGTGACATAVAAFLTGRTGRQSRIVMDGGTLDIEWRQADNHIYLTGPAEFVFDGEVNI